MRARTTPPKPRPRARAAAWGLLAALALGACGPRAPELHSGQAAIPFPTSERTEVAHTVTPNPYAPGTFWATTVKRRHLLLLDARLGWRVAAELDLPALGVAGSGAFALRDSALYVLKQPYGGDERCLLQAADLRGGPARRWPLPLGSLQAAADSLLWLRLAEQTHYGSDLLPAVGGHAYCALEPYVDFGTAPRACTLPCLARLPLDGPPRVEPLPVHYPTGYLGGRPHCFRSAPALGLLPDSSVLVCFPYDPVVLAYRPRSGALDTLGRAHCPGVAPRTDWTPAGAARRDSLLRSAYHGPLFHLPASGRWARLHYLGLDAEASARAAYELGRWALALYSPRFELLRVDSLPGGATPFGTFLHGDTLYVFNALDNPSFPVKPLRYRTYWWGP